MQRHLLIDSLSSGMIKNSDSARLSVPSLLKEIDTNESRLYSWKTDLITSQPFWTGCYVWVILNVVGWFTDLSKHFLMTKAAKLLILAGTDRLDKDLTIAQMQGKFQLVVFPTCGHAIQEDVVILSQSINNHLGSGKDSKYPCPILSKKSLVINIYVVNPSCLVALE